MEMINTSKNEYERLKMQTNMDVDSLKQLVKSVKDIKEGRVIRVKQSLSVISISLQFPPNSQSYIYEDF